MSLNQNLQGYNTVLINSDGKRYEGELEHTDYCLRSFSVKPEGELDRIVTVYEPELTYTPARNLHTRSIPMDDVSNSPYATRDQEVKDDETQEFLEFVQNTDYQLPMLEVRPVEDGFEILDGHRKYALTEELGKDSKRCMVRPKNDWDAMKQFALDHIPRPCQLSQEELENEEERADDWYTDNEIKESMQLVHEEFGDDMYQLARFKELEEELGLEITE